MTTRRSKADELDAEITRLAAECKLDAWTAFVDEMKVPGDIFPALATGRAELIALIQPRPLEAHEAKALFEIIASLIKTNLALREHAERLAQFVGNWADAFKHLHSVGQKVERFANFDHDRDDDARYCKYCHRTHSDWHDDGDHAPGILVCDICDHASKFEDA